MKEPSLLDDYFIKMKTGITMIPGWKKATGYKASKGSSGDPVSYTVVLYVLFLTMR